MAWWDYEEGGDQTISQPTDTGDVGDVNQNDWMYDNTPTDSWMNNPTTGQNYGVETPVQQQPDYGAPNYYGGIDTSGVQTGTGETWNSPTAGGIQNALAGIFNGIQTNPDKFGMGLAAIMEGAQNKKKAAVMRSIASNPALDPFGSQRPFYQQQAQQAVTNPYDSPIVKAQIEQLQRAQSIKDAAAGRRSNSLTSSPAVMAEMAKIAQQYQAQMAQQGGSGIAPNGGAISNALMSGTQSDINGYISPLLTALGWNNQNQSNSSALANLTQDQKTALAKQWATA